MVFCVGLVVVPLLQLLPLPIEVWGLLPGRDVVRETFDLIGEPWGAKEHQQWRPSSRGWPSRPLIPPIAVFLGMVRLSYAERRLLSKVIIGFGLVSVFLGLMQLAQGPNSALRFFKFTNPTEAVGFFANRNHFSALLYVVTLFASCWVIEALASIRGLGRETLLRSRAIVIVAAMSDLYCACHWASHGAIPCGSHAANHRPFCSPRAGHDRSPWQGDRLTHSQIDVRRCGLCHRVLSSSRFYAYWSVLNKIRSRTPACSTDEKPLSWQKPIFRLGQEWGLLCRSTPCTRSPLILFRAMPIEPTTTS